MLAANRHRRDNKSLEQPIPWAVRGLFTMSEECWTVGPTL